MKYEVGIVDDHLLFSKSLSLLLESFQQFSVTLDVTSGAAMQVRLKQLDRVPDIILLDVNMPGMGGVACAEWLGKHYPAIKIAALTINDTDMAVVSMLSAGCCSYLLKNTHPNELEKALTGIAENGYYNVGNTINFNRLMRNSATNFTEAERKFLQFACSDFTYRHIAALMHVSPRKVETYRANVFAKLNVQSRTGLAMEALRRGLVEL